MGYEGGILEVGGQVAQMGGLGRPAGGVAGKVGEGQHMRERCRGGEMKWVKKSMWGKGRRRKGAQWAGGSGLQSGCQAAPDQGFRF